MTSLNTKQLKKMFIAGSQLIANNYEYIDELNVFPVPDGDTGTNMKITVLGASETIQNFDDQGKIKDLGKTFAKGLLMNARGNSGVIMSQIFKGFVINLVDQQNEISISDISLALNKAKEIAYKSVATPIEGTILTVIRVVSEKMNEKIGTFKNMFEVFDFICNEAEQILAKTPDFLPELKAVGVVDSGGYGLCRFFEGMKLALTQEVIPNKETKKAPQEQDKKQLFTFIDNNEGFGYCTEFILKLNSRVSTKQPEKEKYNEEKFKEFLEKNGNSLVYVRDDDLIKVHIHAINPWNIFIKASEYGEYNKVKVENMTLQFLQKNPGTTLEMASKTFEYDSTSDEEIKIIATVPSEEIAEIYKNNLYINEVINCEKIGNPSIQKFLDTIKKTKAKNIIIVTDNSNIILAANEAKNLVRKSECNVKVIGCKDIATSYSVCLSFDPLLDLSTNIKIMNKTFKSAIVGKISKSVKMVKYDHISVAKDDAIGIIGSKILFSNKNTTEVASNLLKELLSKSKKTKNITIIIGKDAVLREVRNIEKFISEKYGIICEVIHGNQPTYSYYFLLT